MSQYIIVFLLLLIEKGTCKTFLYYFRHRPTFAWYPPWMYSDHGAEVFFVMNVHGVDLKFSDEDKQLSRDMVSYWVNFAKTGSVCRMF